MQPRFQKTLSFSAPRIPANKNTKEVTQRKSHSQKQECYPMRSNRTQSNDGYEGNGASNSLLTTIHSHLKEPTSVFAPKCVFIDLLQDTEVVIRT